MRNFVYLAKLHKPLVKHKKNLGCSACLLAESSIVIDRVNKIIAVFDSQILPQTASTSVSLTIIGPTS